MSSVEFYEVNANAFFRDTVATDMTVLYDRFLPFVKSGGIMLDAGCGSGRDALAFLKRGYKVDAFDGSIEMARRASEFTGLHVEHKLFEDLLTSPLETRYDGISCCAALLHLDRGMIEPVLASLVSSLASDGAMYVSFKYGGGERLKDGRRFTDMTENSLARMVETINRCHLAETWTTLDQRPRRDDKWLNAILKI